MDRDREQEREQVNNLRRLLALNNARVSPFRMQNPAVVEQPPVATSNTTSAANNPHVPPFRMPNTTVADTAPICSTNGLGLKSPRASPFRMPAEPLASPSNSNSGLALNNPRVPPFRMPNSSAAALPASPSNRGLGLNNLRVSPFQMPNSAAVEPSADRTTHYSMFEGIPRTPRAAEVLSRMSANQATASTNRNVIKRDRGCTDENTKPEKNPTRIIEKLAPMEGILLQMSCVICQSVPFPPPYVCADGHLACRRCLVEKEKTQCFLKCPFQLGDRVCGKAFTKTNNALFQYIFENSNFHCQNFQGGCEEKPLGCDFFIHADMCRYRPHVKCPFSDCKLAENGLLCSLLFVRHLEEHNVPMAESGTYRIKTNVKRMNIDLEVRPLGATAVNNELRFVSQVIVFMGFSFSVTVRVSNGSVAIWISHMCDPELSNENLFEANIRIRSITTNSSVIWEGAAQDRDKPFEEIVRDGDCLSVSKHALRQKFLFDTPSGPCWNTDIKLTRQTTSAPDLFQKYPHPYPPLKPVQRLPTVVEVKTMMMKKEKEAALARQAGAAENAAPVEEGTKAEFIPAIAANVSVSISTENDDVSTTCRLKVQNPVDVTVSADQGLGNAVAPVICHILDELNVPGGPIPIPVNVTASAEQTSGTADIPDRQIPDEAIAPCGSIAIKPNAAYTACNEIVADESISAKDNAPDNQDSDVRVPTDEAVLVTGDDSVGQISDPFVAPVGGIPIESSAANAGSDDVRIVLGIPPEENAPNDQNPDAPVKEEAMVNGDAPVGQVPDHVISVGDVPIKSCVCTGLKTVFEIPAKDDVATEQNSDTPVPVKEAVLDNGDAPVGRIPNDDIAQIGDIPLNSGVSHADFNDVKDVGETPAIDNLPGEHDTETPVEEGVLVIGDSPLGKNPDHILSPLSDIKMKPSAACAELNDLMVFGEISHNPTSDENSDKPVEEAISVNGDSAIVKPSNDVDVPTLVRSRTRAISEPSTVTAGFSYAAALRQNLHLQPVLRLRTDSLPNESNITD